MHKLSYSPKESGAAFWGERIEGKNERKSDGKKPITIYFIAYSSPTEQHLKSPLQTQSSTSHRKCCVED